MRQEKALGRAQSGTGSNVDFTGTWVNELGSVAQITQSGGTLSGTYQSQVSSGGTPATGELVGYANGDLIAFTVYWNEFQAITAWVGQLAPNSSIDTINTLWQMTNQVAPGDEWASINAGSDSFTRQ